MQINSFENNNLNVMKEKMVESTKTYPKRKQIRLQNYDYSQNGLYFITICTQNHESIFDEVDENGKIILNDAGAMIDKIWNNIPFYYQGFKLYNYAIMPNHFHSIIEICPYEYS